MPWGNERWRLAEGQCGLLNDNWIRRDPFAVIEMQATGLPSLSARSAVARILAASSAENSSAFTRSWSTRRILSPVQVGKPAAVLSPEPIQTTNLLVFSATIDRRAMWGGC